MRCKGGTPAHKWLTEWTTNDSPATPLLWTYLARFALYLSIDGSDHTIESNDLYAMILPLSNRVYHTAPSGNDK